MRSRLRRLSVGLSLLLAILVAALWARSYFRVDSVVRASVRPWQDSILERRNAGFESGRGVIVFGCSRLAGPVLADQGWRWDSYPPRQTTDRAMSFWGRIGFGFARHTAPEPSADEVRRAADAGNGIYLGGSSLALPHWALVLALSIAPALRWRRARRPPAPPVERAPAQD